VPGAQLERVAKLFATEKPATLIWCMGANPAHGWHRQRARLLHRAPRHGQRWQVRHGGANIFRGHTNVQGATDLGLDIVTLPLYYGLAEGAWKHWCRVWEVDFGWMEARFDTITAADGKPVKMNEYARHSIDALVRRHGAAKDQVSQKGQPEGHGGHGPWAAIL
jgi:formate dehydrogenase major subunit